VRSWWTTSWPCCRRCCSRSKALSFIARYLNPPDFDRVMAAAGEPDTALRAIRPRLAQWPADFTHIRTPLERQAMRCSLRSMPCASCKTATAISSACSCAASLPRAQEALYALSARLPPVSQFFIDPALHGDADLAAQLAAPANENTGVFTIRTSPTAAAASRSTCRNITRPTAHGRW
jgi:phospholipase/carboxylesterase